LKDVLKAADRSLGAIEKAARSGHLAAGDQAARDYVNLVGWVERLFLDAQSGGPPVDLRDTERARKALARHGQRLESIDDVARDPESARLVGEAREATSAALAAVDSTMGGQHHDASDHDRRRGGCGRS
jgi:hypothetical protein